MRNARRRALLFALGITAALALPAAAQADTFTFSGPGVDIPDNGSTTSTIEVSGLAGTITGASATLGVVTHQNPDDIDSAISAPNGTAVFLMSDACGTEDMFKTINFSDTAGIFLQDAGPCPNNPYMPSNYDGVGDPIAANNAFSFFNGGDPNGTWTLVIADDAATNTGSIASWSITLDGLTESATPPATAPSTPGGTLPNPQKVLCAGVPSTQLGGTGNDNLIGTAGADVISGAGGNDQVSGLNGKDLICGGDGRDLLRGGKGKDTLRGELGKDTLKGGKGADALKGGPGKDKQIQ
jgi:Ca2+-binding RTX toxin-like protein